MLKNIKKEVNNNPLVYFTLSAILLLALFLRLYRVNDLLGFWFDQGRDGLVIWNLWHHGKLFLIGTITGIAGIYRGPWYYYLIALFYLMGGGNPVWPVVFLSLTSVLALLLVFLIAKEISDRTAGLLAVFIAALSSYIVNASRWLSNPTPMLLISALLIYLLIHFIKSKKP